MPYTFRFETVEYEAGGGTLLTGFIETGEMFPNERLSVPTRSGVFFEAAVNGMEVHGLHVTRRLWRR
jgi:hypothetical protein